MNGKPWIQVCLWQLAAGGDLGPLAQQGPQAFDEHQRADDAEESDVAEPDHQIDLADSAQKGEEPDAEGRAEQAADQQHGAHLEVDVAALPMRQHAGDGGGDDLIGLGTDGDGRRNADEDQDRRHEKPAADPEEPGKKADRPA